MMKKFHQALLANLNDKVKPTLASAVTTSSITSSSVSIDWTSGTDNYGIKSYEIYGNGKLLATVGAKANRPHITANLTANTNYELKLVAKDFSGNVSDSIKTTFKTQMTPAAAESQEMLNKILLAQNIEGTTLNIQYAEGCTLEFIGIYGQLILSHTVSKSEEAVAVPLNLTGQYFVKITNNQNQYLVKRFVKL